MVQHNEQLNKEKEIKVFKGEEYWRQALDSKEGRSQDDRFRASYQA